MAEYQHISKIELIKKSNLILNHELYHSKEWCLYSTVLDFLNSQIDFIDIEILNNNSCAIIVDISSVYNSTKLHQFHDMMYDCEKEYFVQVYVNKENRHHGNGSLVLNKLLERINIERNLCCASTGSEFSTEFWIKNDIDIINY